MLINQTARDLTVRFKKYLSLINNLDYSIKEWYEQSDINWHRFINLINKYRATFIIPRNTKTNVVVRIVRRVVQIQRQNTSVVVVVPVATTDETVKRHIAFISFVRYLL